MKRIALKKITGSFAENKDLAREVRLGEIIPAIDNKEEVVLDFEGVDSATQSFVHALISDIIRKYGPEVLDTIYFKNCNETVKKMIGIVIEYMQETE
jgi:hypothetical protein